MTDAPAGKTDPDAAYRAAEAEIARVKEAGINTLSLDADDFRALNRIPPSIVDLSTLEILDLDLTQVADLAPLAGLTALEILSFENTHVADITPLAGLTTLKLIDFDNTQVTDLTPLAGLTRLQELELNNTRVADLTPIRNLSALKRLEIDDTEVADLSPLKNHRSLRDVGLSGTRIRDLRPLLTLPKLTEASHPVIRFEDTPATASDPELRRLADVIDPTDRTDQTLAYLRTLPPWPEPLPWVVQDGADIAPPAPDPEDGLPLDVMDGLLELVRTPRGPGEDTLHDISFARLREAVMALVRHGNQHPEIAAIAKSLLKQTEGTLEEASLYDIHLDVAALNDLVATNASRAEQERLDGECVAAVKAVTRLGPPLTIEDPEVIRFEEAHARFAGTTRDETVRRGEKRVVEALAKTPDGIGPDLGTFAGKVAAQPDGSGRMDTLRALLTKNTVIYAGLCVAGASLVGHITVETAKAAWTAAPGLWAFLVSNKDAIMAAAVGWGEQAHVWTADLLSRAMEISRLRHGSPDSDEPRVKNEGS